MCWTLLVVGLGGIDENAQCEHYTETVVLHTFPVSPVCGESVIVV